MKGWILEEFVTWAAQKRQIVHFNISANFLTVFTFLAVMFL
jgi:hypothetical protein